MEHSRNKVLCCQKKFGEVLRARKFYNQVKKVKIKLLVYNINKKAGEIICIKLGISTEPAFHVQ